MSVYVMNGVISVSIFAFQNPGQNVLPNGVGYYPKTTDEKRLLHLR